MTIKTQAEHERWKLRLLKKRLQRPQRGFTSAADLGKREREHDAERDNRALTPVNELLPVYAKDADNDD